MRVRNRTDTSLLQRLRADDGIALVIALCTMVVLTVIGTTAMSYTTRGQSQAHRSKADQLAFALAEAGLNNAVATLGNPSVNALSASALPTSEAAASSLPYEGGIAKWWGRLDAQTHTWSLVGRGIVFNPTGAGDVVRTTTEEIDVLADLTQPLNNEAWNYLMATRTGDGDGCDEELRQSVTIAAPLYVYGNLCLYNTASIMPAVGPPNPPPAVNLVVGGRIAFNQPQNTIGTRTQPIASAYVAGGCNGHACRPNGGGDPLWASLTGTMPPAAATKPVADWDSWYENATPGPRHPCNQFSGVGGPVFDNDSARTPPNGSVPLWNMTPASTDYTCRVVSGGGAVIGELSWNHTTKVLTVRGVIYIDGSVEVTASPVNYNGQASIYLTGTFSERQDAQLCGGIRNGACDFASWNPNSELLLIMAAGDDGTRASISLNQSSKFQGGLYAANDVVVGQSASFEGPMMGGSLVFNNSVSAQPFPLIETVPLGTPGNPNIYAKPQTPRNFSG
jgi:hypothetical protein